jgi:hypothetical protein
MKLKTTLALLLVTASSQGASLLTLSNPVADGSINTSATNSDRSDWSTTIAFPTDPDEGNATDFSSITVAHDSTSFFIREQLYRTSNSGFFAGNQILLLDTDQNRTTGYAGPSGIYATGSEYMLEGTSLFAFTGGGDQSAFSFSFLGTVSFDDFPLNDHELSFSRALIGSPTSFDLMAISDYFGNADIYPDTALGAATGGFYTYTTIPEPGAALLGCLGVLALFNRRSQRRSGK